jgi:outer membrane protein assembly factor BamB
VAIAVVAATIGGFTLVGVVRGPILSAGVSGGGASATTTTRATSPRETGTGASAPAATEPAPNTPGPPVTLNPSAQPASAGPQAPSGNRFGEGLLIADRANGRLLIVDDRGTVLWRFPGPHSLPRGQRFAADDAFVAPDGQTIVANDESHQVVDRIDIVSRRVVWQYGRYDQSGSGAGELHTPDDAYPLANGDIVIADIRNCRVIEVAPTHRIVHQWGRTAVCRDDPPRTYGEPNGDTPLPDGGLLITEIRGSRVVRLAANGHVIFDIHVPVRYPSDAQLDASGNVVVVDYSNPGAVLIVSPHGRVLWRYARASGRGRLDHPSLAMPLSNGMIVVNDDFRQRVVVIDPKRSRIVWQYGRTDVRGSRPGLLSIPDGVDLVSLGTRLR